MKGQKVYVTKVLYSSGGFCVAVHRQYQRDFPFRFAQSRATATFDVLERQYHTIRHPKRLYYLTPYSMGSFIL
jgi:hypothetical protein